MNKLVLALSSLSALSLCSASFAWQQSQGVEIIKIESIRIIKN